MHLQSTLEIDARGVTTWWAFFGAITLFVWVVNSVCILPAPKRWAKRCCTYTSPVLKLRCPAPYRGPRHSFSRLTCSGCRNKSSANHNSSLSWRTFALYKSSSSWHTPHDCGHSCFKLSGFSSHSPSSAHVLQSLFLSSHTVEHTPHDAGHSDSIMTGFLRHSSANAQIAPIVEFVSLHGRSDLQVSRLQLFGQVLRTWPGLLTHSPRFAHPGQSLCVSLHAEWHTPHATGQCMFIKSGFERHCPSLAQTTQSSCRSVHLGLQRPHDVAHSASMYSGDDSHSPFTAHRWQSSCRSEHTM